VIDNYAPRAGLFEYAVFAEYYSAHIIVIADTAEYDFGIRRGLASCPGAGAGMFLQPQLGARRRPVEDRDFVSRFGKVAGHGKAHDAESDECNSHVSCS
jgi:hypothetical protein